MLHRAYCRARRGLNLQGLGRYQAMEGGDKEEVSAHSRASRSRSKGRRDHRHHSAYREAIRRPCAIPFDPATFCWSRATITFPASFKISHPIHLVAFDAVRRPIFIRRILGSSQLTPPSSQGGQPVGPFDIREWRLSGYATAGSLIRSPSISCSARTSWRFPSHRLFASQTAERKTATTAAWVAPQPSPPISA